MAKLPTLIREAPHVERRIHAALVEDSRKPSTRDGVLGLSTIGDCERNLWMSLNGIPKDPERESEGRILALFKHGHAVEAHVVGLLEIAGYEIQDRDFETGRQFRFEAEDGRIAGHIDGKIWTAPAAYAPEWKLLEIKSASIKKFEELLPIGYAEWNPKYAAQVQAYMGAFELDDSLVVVYCKDDSRIYAEKIRHDPAQSAALLEKAHRIVNATELPDRPKGANGQYSKFCKFCDRAAHCYSALAGVSFDA
jgi:hypothetical protein